MVNSIVYSAVARKMLCNPVNSLIADTEFACSAGMLLRILKADEDGYHKALENETVEELQSWLFKTYDFALSREFDTPVRNLIMMAKSYHTEKTPFEKRLKELLTLGYQEELRYPKGRFL